MSLLDVLRAPAACVPRPVAGEAAIVELADPNEVTVPLEYPGGLLPPVVQAGDVVSRCQVIGRSSSGVCAHASIGGKVREISRIWTASGRQVPAVVIGRDDDSGRAPDETAGCPGVDSASATRVQLLKGGGVISPWTTPPAGAAKIRHVVIQGHDEEPTHHVQELLLQEHAALLQAGLRLLRDVAPRADIVLTVPRLLVGWARETFGDHLEVVGVGDRYRRRLVRLLVPQLTGLKVPAHLPYHARGVAVLTVEAALAAQEALEGRPFVRKALTVSGGSLFRPLTVRTAIGTRVRDVLAACGLTAEEAARVVAGGPMRGTALYTDETPVDKSQHGVHLLAAAELPGEANLNCVNCGRCVRACPAHLQVHLIGRHVQYGLPEDAADLHPEACLDCGLCAFVCPAERPLVQMVKMAVAARRTTP